MPFLTTCRTMMSMALISASLLNSGCGGQSRQNSEGSVAPRNIAASTNPAVLEISDSEINLAYREYNDLGGGVRIRLKSSQPIFLKNDEPLTCRVLSGILADGKEITIEKAYGHFDKIQLMTPWILLAPDLSNAAESFCSLPLSAPVNGIKGLKSVRVRITGRIEYYLLGDAAFRWLEISKVATVTVNEMQKK